MPKIELSDVCKLSLKEIFGDDNKGKEDFEYVEGIVKLALFSNFPKRRRWAAARISNAFCGKEVKIQTINLDGVVYAYLKFNEAIKYVFVGQYSKYLRLLEPAPEEIEIAQWSM